MITNGKIYMGCGTDPFWNLAVEEYFLEHLAPNSCILYLWQNQNTVVIGKNQNAWAECRTELLAQEGGKLARRLSGGGAVFHDLGNLNFTFIVTKENYDLDRQFSVIRQACKLAGIQVERSGRNDLLAQGRKFSGNAFYKGKVNAYHHGTLLIRSEMEKLQRYLTPPKAKLQSKGVSSVRSRVVNLSELSSELSCEQMKIYMGQAFETVYGVTAEKIYLDDSALQKIQTIGEKISSWDYLYGRTLPFSATLEKHFPWGHVQLGLETASGKISGAKLYTDAMDWSLPDAVESALKGCAFSGEAMAQTLEKNLDDPEILRDLKLLIKEQL